MIARRIDRATHNLAPPEGLESECRSLWVRASREGRLLVLESAWEPTPAELKQLNAGGSVVLRVVGAQPPVELVVEPIPPEEKPPEPG